MIERARGRRASARVFVATTLVLMAASAVLTEAVAAASGGAHVAGVVSVKDKAELHLLHAFGNTLVEEGKATGNLPGTVKISLNINPERGTASATFTLATAAGSLTGSASGTASPGKNGWESMSATLTIRHGTRRYSRASGTGHMYGAIYRRTDRLVAQVVGRIRD